MAQRTVLELVQGILNEMGSDKVNSISDTIESEDVASILRQVYSEIVDEYSLPSTQTLSALTGLGDTDLPNLMQIPDDEWNIKWIKYDCRLDVSGDKAYRDIQYMDPIDFVTLVNGQPSTDTTNYVVVQWDANVPLVINKVKAPTYWTSFDDNYIVFDSYDSNVDSTLQSSKSMYFAETRPQLSVEDDAIPDLPQNLENLLYITALNRCMSVKTRELNPKTNQEENRLRIRGQRNKWRQGRQTFEGPDYGRK